jgi:hypothetical protein
MKSGSFSWKRIAAVVAVLLLTCGIYWAQQGGQGTLVNQSSTRYDAGTTCATSATSAATITFSAVSGQYFYITEIDFQNVVGATAVTAAAATSVTTTNITGSPAWTMASGTTAGSATQIFSVNYPTGLKSSAPGTATTIVLPTFATNQTIRVNACGYYGP